MSTNIHQSDKLEVLEKIRSDAGSVRMSLFNREYDYLLKVANRDRKELEQFIRKLNKLGITRIQTSLALREIKYSRYYRYEMRNRASIRLLGFVCIK